MHQLLRLRPSWLLTRAACNHACVLLISLYNTWKNCLCNCVVSFGKLASPCAKAINCQSRLKTAASYVLPAVTSLWQHILGSAADDGTNSSEKACHSLQRVNGNFVTEVVFHRQVSSSRGRGKVACPLDLLPCLFGLTVSRCQLWLLRLVS